MYLLPFVLVLQPGLPIVHLRVGHPVTQLRILQEMATRFRDLILSLLIVNMSLSDGIPEHFIVSLYVVVTSVLYCVVLDPRLPKADVCVMVAGERVL